MTDAITRLNEALEGRYDVEQEIGQGGMATVYRARDLRHNRSVALKVLKAELAAVVGAERFLAEIETTAKLTHPHILPLHDSGEAGSFLFYVMPLVEGESLRDRLDRDHQLPVDESVRIGAALAEALDYAHRHGVIHRDIKPGNVLIHDGQPVISDFGIALAVGAAGGGRLTETGLSMGTPHYMSPEQATGDTSVGPASDIYALGCVLYEMLVGEPPYTGGTPQAILGKIITKEPDPVRDHRRAVPANVEAAVAKALEKLPADRFGTAKELAEALRNPAFSGPVGVTRQASGTTWWLRRSLVNWQAAAGIALVAGAAALAGGLLFSDEALPPSLVARFAIEADIPPVGTDGVRVGVSGDGSLLAYAAVSNDGRPAIHLRPLGEDRAAPIPGTEGGQVDRMYFSPDGEQLVFRRNTELVTIPTRGGTARLLTALTPSGGLGAAWLEGDVIVFHDFYGGGLFAVSAAAGGDRRQVTTIDPSSGVDHRWPTPLPGGKAVVFTIWDGQLETARVGWASIETREVKDLTAGLNPHYLDPGYLVYASGEGVLHAVAFDADRGELAGAPVTLLQDIPPGVGSVDFALSPNGVLVYVSKEAGLTPVLVSVDGGVIDRLPGLEPGQYGAPRFSSGGDRIALMLDDEIWVYDLAGTTLTPLTSESGFYPLWRDDLRILYAREEGEDVSVYQAWADRSREPERVYRQPGEQYRTQSMRPSGDQVMLRRSVGLDDFDLYALALDDGDDTEPVPWITTPAMERGARFSPDGTWIAYSSDDAGIDEVYVAPFPGPGGVRRISQGGGSEPAWAPDGSRLYFRQGNRFLAVDVETEPTFRVVSGAPVTVFEGRYWAYAYNTQYDVHPNGDRVVALQFGANPSELTVAVNFTEEVRLRLEN